MQNSSVRRWLDSAEQFDRFLGERGESKFFAKTVGCDGRGKSTPLRVSKYISMCLSTCLSLVQWELGYFWRHLANFCRVCERKECQSRSERRHRNGEKGKKKKNEKLVYAISLACWLVSNTVEISQNVIFLLSFPQNRRGTQPYKKLKKGHATQKKFKNCCSVV